MSTKWDERKRPVRLERKFIFEEYEQTREFLERAAELAEREEYYPDMSFGRTHVSVTLQGEDDAEEVSDTLYRYAQALDAIAEEFGG